MLSFQYNMGCVYTPLKCITTPRVMTASVTFIISRRCVILRKRLSKAYTILPSWFFRPIYIRSTGKIGMNIVQTSRLNNFVLYFWFTLELRSEDAILLLTVFWQLMWYIFRITWLVSRGRVRNICTSVYLKSWPLFFYLLYNFFGFYVH